MVKERWKQIMDAHRYEVSDKGRVRKTGSHEIVKLLDTPSRNKIYVSLKLDSGRGSTRQLDRLVLNTFGEYHSPFKYILVHKDGNSKNNEFSNLEWQAKTKSLGKRIIVSKGTAEVTFSSKAALVAQMKIASGNRKNMREICDELRNRGYGVRIEEFTGEFNPDTPNDLAHISDPETKKMIRKKVDVFVDYLSKKYDELDTNGKHRIGCIDEKDEVVMEFRLFQKKYNL